jgi:hypothetical protein
MTTVSRLARLPLVLIALSSVAMLEAQSTPAGPRTNYWLTAGAGWGLALESGDLAAENAVALTGAATIQYGPVVASLRTAHASPKASSLWDAGLLAGIGSPTRYRMRGSVAAGVGRLMGPGASAWTLPVELQLAWRLRPTLAVAAYGFGSFTGPHEMLGATIALQVGRLD